MTKILDIVDMQNSFMAKNGSLYIDGAFDLIGKANEFLARANGFDFALLKYDTHFKEEYEKSEEAKMFPNHCLFGTYDWQLAIDPDLITSFPKYYMMKNQFDMWAKIKKIDRNFDNISAYKALFRVNDRIDNFEDSIQRNDFFVTKAKDFKNFTVYMMGVASDYCNRYAFEGYLKRGASVIIIEDLTKGISLETNQVINESQYLKWVENGKLKIINSDEL